MVKCHICSREVFSGWICGIVPAHDRYKLGLCREHDTPENRAEVQGLWENLMRGEMQSALELSRKSAKPVLRLGVRIHFRDGGVKTLSCAAYDVNQDKDLLVLSEQGELTFYPLQHILDFSVREILVDDPQSPGSNAKPPALTHRSS